MVRRIQNIVVILAALIAAILVIETQTDWLTGTSGTIETQANETVQTP